jgi:uncharacterized protein YbbC (DUF1343 family)
MSSAVRFGIDGLLQFPVYNKYRIGLVTNDAATTSRGALSRLALLEKKFRLVKLFSPEHGLSARAADGLSLSDATDGLTHLPVISLYGDHLAPTEEDLADIDLVVYDLPDIGCRFYTYQWTLSYVMESCSNFNKPLLILDRPNPLSGDLLLAEGPMLDEVNCSSFIGRWTMPLRHSSTIGELASYWNDLKKLNVDLQIVKMEHWERKKFFSDLGIAFVPTSPAIPYFTIALLYPGTGLLEGVNISEGRGTPYPFKICGAPFINAGQLTRAFNALAVPGIKASPYNFVPVSGKYEKENCYGIMLHITDQLVLRPVTVGLSIINLLINLYPGKITGHAYKTAANPTGEKHLEKLTGMSGIWSLLQQEVATFQINLPEMVGVNEWESTMEPWLLY